MADQAADILGHVEATALAHSVIEEVEPNSASHRSTGCAPASDSPMSRRVLQERRHPLEDAASIRGVAEINTSGKSAALSAAIPA